MRYVPLYNTQLPQSALGCRTPMQAMKDWHKSHPHIFVKSPRNRPGRDSASCPCYYLPSRRGCRFRHDGQGHSRRDPPLAGAAVMRMNSKAVGPHKTGSISLPVSLKNPPVGQRAGMAAIRWTSQRPVRRRLLTHKRSARLTRGEYSGRYAWTAVHLGNVGSGPVRK